MSFAGITRELRVNPGACLVFRIGTGEMDNLSTTTIARAAAAASVLWS